MTESSTSSSDSSSLPSDDFANEEPVARVPRARSNAIFTDLHPLADHWKVSFFHRCRARHHMYQVLYAYHSAFRRELCRLANYNSTSSGFEPCGYCFLLRVRERTRSFLQDVLGILSVECDAVFRVRNQISRCYDIYSIDLIEMSQFYDYLFSSGRLGAFDLVRG